VDTTTGTANGSDAGDEGAVDYETLMRNAPQGVFRMMREHTPVFMSDFGAVVTRHEDVTFVLRNPDIFSSGMEAVYLGNDNPLIPLQIDPPEHVKYRKLLDPLFAPKQVAKLEPRTRALVRDLVARVADTGSCDFHKAVAEPLPSTVFLEILGLPVERVDEFIVLKDGLIRPQADSEEGRRAAVRATALEVYAILEETIDDHLATPRDDLVSQFLTFEVDGERLTREDILSTLHLFFMAGLDTVTASLDCMLAYLAQHDEHRAGLAADPSLIPAAIEELLRWETPVTGVARVATRDIELAGCPIGAGTPVSVLLGSANTDEAAWERADTVDFHRDVNKHIAFGGGVHRCLGSHLARMELRVALEEWTAAVPDYRIAPGHTLDYTSGLRQIEPLPLVW
jgi:cytochrome P450